MIKNKSKPYLLIFSLLFAHIYSLDYSLQDVNTTSDTYQELVGPSFLETKVNQYPLIILDGKTEVVEEVYLYSCAI